MMNITLSVPSDIYARMKIHKEIRWSEVVRRAIAEFIAKLEERGSETMTGDLFEDLGSDFKKSLSELSFEKAEKGDKKMRDAEWKRVYRTQTH